MSLTRRSETAHGARHATKNQPAWFTTRSRIYWYDQYALNQQQTAFAKYDPDRIAEELKATGADIIAIYATNQFGIAYYPSAIWPQHPNLKGRDYVGDLCARLRRAGKRILLYINWLDSKHAAWNVQYLGQDPAAQRAEQPLATWAEPTRRNGRVQALPGGRWNNPCFNSPQREQIVALTREICDRYQPDAFHLDMFFTTGICVCNFCRPSLQRICGTATITREAIHAHWVDYINWRCARSAALIADVSAVLHERGIIAAHNAFAPLYQSAAGGVDQGWLAALDVYVSECFDAFMIGDLNATSINLRWQHAVGKPAWILRTSTPMYYAHWPITAAQWALYAAACKANGAAVFGPCGVGARPDTTSSPRLLARVRTAFDMFMQDADLAPNAASAARTALVFSWATRKYFEPDSTRWADELYGWARFLIEEHIPFDIIVAENIAAAAALRRYDLVILPDVPHVSTVFCAAIENYVRHGGRLLATGASSLGDESGARRADFQLADVFGVHHRETRHGHMAVARPTEPEPATGTFQLVAPQRGTVAARYMDVDTYGGVCEGLDPLPIRPTDWPAEVHCARGKGQCRYVSFDIGRFFNAHGDEHIAAWMKTLMDGLIPTRQIKTNAPRTVEITVWRQPAPERIIIHLANRTVPWTLPTRARQFTEILPVHDLALTLAHPYPHAKVSCRGATLRVTKTPTRLSVRIPVLEAYAAIVIARAPGVQTT